MKKQHINTLDSPHNQLLLFFRRYSNMQTVNQTTYHDMIFLT